MPRVDAIGSHDPWPKLVNLWRMWPRMKQLTMAHLADPWPVWPVTHDPVPDHGISRSRLLHYESWWVRHCCLLFSAIWNSWYGLYTVSLVVRTSVVKAEHGGNSSLFIGHVFYGTDPRDPFTFVDPFDPWPADPLTHSHLSTHLTHDPLTHCLLCAWLTSSTCDSLTYLTHLTHNPLSFVLRVYRPHTSSECLTMYVNPWPTANSYPCNWLYTSHYAQTAVYEITFYCWPSDTAL